MVHRVKANRGPTVALFDIRVGTNEKDVIVITPNELESNPTLVQGRVVLSLNDSISVRSITLRLYGVVSVAWLDPTASNRTPPTRSSQKQTKTIFDKEWSFLPPRLSTFTLQQGNYEYPFEVLLPDDIPESVEGLPGGAIIYKMKAVVERTGLVNRNLTCRKHIRIARTMSPTSFEFLQSQCIENLWPGKCQYAIEIPTTAHIIGSQIPYHLHMIPYAKGLSISRLDVELSEHYSFAILDSKNALIAEKKMERSIKSLSDDQRPEEEEDWNVHGYLEVPNSLDRCTQDCDTNFIKVKHRIKFIVGLRNADGHISEIRASLPVALVLPPYISSTGTTPHLEDATVNQLCHLGDGEILPTYESRIYDRLWDGVSYHDLNPSALNTPIIMSRRTSEENLRDFGDLTMPNPGDLEAELHRALRERNAQERDHDHVSSENLPALATSSGTTPTYASSTPRPSTSSIQGTTVLNGEEHHPRLTPTSSPETQHISPSPSNASHVSLPIITRTSSDEYVDISWLNRVPSYKTANSSILNLDPISNALPSYTTVVSSPPSSSSLNVTRSQPRFRAGSNASSRSHSPESRPRPPPPVARAPSVRQTNTGVSSSGVGSVYGSEQTFDDPMRRISLMRSIFSHR